MYKQNDTSSMSAVQLAALSTSLIPDLAVVSVLELEDASSYLKFSMLKTQDGKMFLLVVPKTKNDSSAFLKEIANLKILDGQFQVPQVVADNNRLAILKPYGGKTIQVADIDKRQVQNLASDFANLHSLSYTIVEENGLPTFTNKQQQKILIDTLDGAALTGKVPTGLLDRFENFLDDKENWQYDSAFINGSIIPEHILFDGDKIECVTEWRNLQFSDPALDFAYILPKLPVELVSIFSDTYKKIRSRVLKRQLVDSRFEERAYFYANFVLVTEFMQAKASANEELIEAAVQRLEELDTKLKLADQLDAVETAAQEKQAAQEAEQRRKELQNDLSTERISREDVEALGASLPNTLVSAKPVNTKVEVKPVSQQPKVNEEPASAIELELQQMLNNESGKIDLRHQPDPTRPPTAPTQVIGKTGANDSFSFKQYTGDIKKGQ
ncbi:hypothetical protein FACS1894125_2220 [Actinomycetota bacterium]|nr:hypothetical protein FACS1894125_2220 [Actinomycetota bacterium]